MGCFPRIGCLLTLLALGAAGAWWYGDRFPAVATKAAAKAAGGVAKAAEQAGARLTAIDSVRRVEATRRHWAPLPADEAPAGRRVLVRLGRRSGPAFVSLGADTLALALGASLAALLPADVTAPALALQGDRLYLRGVVERRALMGSGALRSLLGGVVDGRDTLVLEGQLTLARPGVAHYRVRGIQLGRVAIPDPLRPALVGRLRRVPDEADSADPAATDGPPVPEDVLALAVPILVADVRLADGRAVFYRAVPQ